MPHSFDKAKNGQETNFTDIVYLIVFKHIVVRFNRWFKKKTRGRGKNTGQKLNTKINSTTSDCNLSYLFVRCGRLGT